MISKSGLTKGTVNEEIHLFLEATENPWWIIYFSHFPLDLILNP